MKKIIITILLFSSICFAQTPQRTTRWDIGTRFGTVSSSFNVANQNVAAHIFNWSLQSGVMTACTLSFQSSPDNVTWTTQSTGDCSSSGTTSYLMFVANFIRVSATSYTPQSGTILISVNWNGYIIPPTNIATITTAPLTNQNINSIRYCDNFNGASVTAKLDACITDMPSSGGSVGITASLGSGEPTNPPPDKKMLLDFRGTYDLLGETTARVGRPVNLFIRSDAGALSTKNLTGTITFTSGSTAVTAVGGAFTTELAIGDVVRLSTDIEASYGKISSITNANALVLSANYTGTGGAGTGVIGQAHFPFAIRHNVTGGTPNTGASGESVGFTVIGRRTAGSSRVIFGMNVNEAFATKSNGAAAGEFDLSNSSGVDWNANGEGAEGQQAFNLRLVSAGTAKIQGHLLQDCGGMVGSPCALYGTYYNRVGSIANIFSKSASTTIPHAVFVPFADNSNLAMGFSNAANSVTLASIFNDGTSQFTAQYPVAAGGTLGSSSLPWAGTFRTAKVRAVADNAANAIFVNNAADAATVASITNQGDAFFARLFPNSAGLTFGSAALPWNATVTPLTIGTSGNAITNHFTGTGSLDFAAWAGGDCQNITLTVTGAADGNTAVVGVPNALASLAGVQFTAFVSSANTVTVRGCKITAGASADPAAAGVRVDVWQH